MILKLLTEHHLEFLSLKVGCRGSPKSIMSKCHILGNLIHWLIYMQVQCQGSGSKETTEDLMTPCSADEPGAIKMDFTKVPGDKLLVPVVEMVNLARGCYKPFIGPDKDSVCT